MFTLIANHWVFTVAHEFGHLPAPVSLIVLLVFCSLNNIYFPLALVFAHQISKGSAKLFALHATLSLWAFEDWLHGLFPWTISYTLIPHSPGLIEYADTIGFRGLTLLIFLLNATLFLWLLKPKQKPVLAALLLLGLVFMGLELTGKRWRDSQMSRDKELRTFRVAAVQPNVGNMEKLIAHSKGRFQFEAIDQLLSLSESVLSEGLDLVVWPETASPIYMDSLFESEPSYLVGKLSEWTQKHDVELMTGAYLKGSEKIYNSSVLVSSRESQSYKKSILLPFGEYFPFEFTHKWVRTFVPSIANFGFGTGPKVFTLRNGIRVGPQICYEGLFPSFSRDQVNLGADLFVNLTNDSWFGKHVEPYQHMHMTFARTYETRRPLLRATNTGITAAHLPGAPPMPRSPVHEPWAHTFEIPIGQYPDTTLFVRYGHLALKLIPLIWVLTLFLLAIRPRKL